MAIKLLENIGIENTGIGASALNNLITGNKSGIVGNYLNECAFTATGNTVIIDKGLLIICGRQVELDAIESITLSSVPSEDVRYQIVIELIREESGEVTASIFARQPSTLIQENLMKDGFVYQFELGRVTHKKTGQVTEVLRTADILYGQSGAVADLEVGEVTTAMVDTNIPAEVNINKVLDDGKTKLNFDFLLPKPYDENITDLVSATTTTGNPVNIQNTNNGFVDKVKILNDTASAISSPINVKSVGKQQVKVVQGSVTNSGITVSVDSNNVISVTGTATATRVFRVNVSLTSDAGLANLYTPSEINIFNGFAYTLSLIDKQGNGNCFVYLRGSTDNYVDFSISDSSKTFTATNTSSAILAIVVVSGNTVDRQFKLQLERGNIATDYEPYQSSEAVIPIKDTSGTVLDLNPADVIEMIDGKYHLNSTELHDDSQDALRSIPTYQGQTNLIGNQPFTFDVTEFQLGLESIDAMLTLPDGTRVNVLTKDRMVYITSGEYNGKTLDYVLQEMQNDINGGILYDKVIRTQTDFETLIASPTWLDAVSVAFVGQFTLSTANNSGVKRPANVTRIDGYNNAKITVTNFVYGSTTAKGGLWDDADVNNQRCYINDLTVDCTSTDNNGYGFNGSKNTYTNCTGTGTGAGISIGYGFRGVNNTYTNCTGTGTGAGTGYGFSGSNNTYTNCTGTGTGTGISIGFSGVNNRIISCTALAYLPTDSTPSDTNCVPIFNGSTSENLFMIIRDCKFPQIAKTGYQQGTIWCNIANNSTMVGSIKDNVYHSRFTVAPIKGENVVADNNSAVDITAI